MRYVAGDYKNLQAGVQKAGRIAKGRRFGRPGACLLSDRETAHLPQCE
jgi:hypothetical protein